MSKATVTTSPDLTLRDLGDWARMQAVRLRQNLPDDAASDPAFVLSQAAKLAEEVGELQAEVLGQAGYQRKSKTFTAESMAGEVADVIICAAILASSHDIDLGKALAAKLEMIEGRHSGNGN
jgi:NTP pyrophosphatase (non-canonical NTP hydrolase)